MAAALTLRSAKMFLVFFADRNLEPPGRGFGSSVPPAIAPGSQRTRLGCCWKSGNKITPS